MLVLGIVIQRVCETDNLIKYVLLPLLLAAFFKLSITDDFRLSNMNRCSSPGYRDLKVRKKKKVFCVNVFIKWNHGVAVM